MIKKKYLILPFFLILNITISQEFKELLPPENLVGNFSENKVQATFSATDVPSGVSASFNPTSLSSSDVFSLTLNNVNSLSAGEYPIKIRGNGLISSEIEVILKSPKEVIEMVKNGQLWVGDSVGVIMKAYLMFPELFGGFSV